jgi:PAS domain-containing protein
MWSSSVDACPVRGGYRAFRMSHSSPPGGDAAPNPWQPLFEQASAAMAIIDLQGKYLHVNDAFCTMLGYR